MKDQVIIDGVLYRRVLNESLWKPYTKYHEELSDGSTPLIAEFSGKEWSAKVVLRPMDGTPDADEIDLTINAQRETSRYQLQSYELDDLRDDFEDICKVLNREPDLDTVIGLPDRFDMDDITDEDNVFSYEF